MSVLSDVKILEERDAKRILIEPFNPAQLNPNSYDVCLGRYLKVWKGGPDDAYDTKAPEKVEHLWELVDLEDYPNGYTLLPGVPYLGHTNERCGSWKYVPEYHGRSSTARIFLNSHLGGLGDVGFDDQWTLEISVMIKTIVYFEEDNPMRIGQVKFTEVVDEDDSGSLYEPRTGAQYCGQKGPTTVKKLYK